jgi:cysteine desulfurase
MKLPVYMDYAATTPIDPRVAEVMGGCLLSDVFGNASSAHEYGNKAQAEIDWARNQVAELIHAEPAEIIWTSGATEAINLGLKGAAQLYQQQGKHVVTLKTEHKAVLDTCQHLEKEGYSVTYLTPEPNGLVDIEKFQAALRPDTILVAICHLNNEIGAVQDIAALAKMTAARGILMLVDAAQSVGKLALNMREVPVDLLVMSAHKVYGPKGVGALYIRRKPRVRVAAQMHGGGHQEGMRSGTLPTHQIVGMGEALRIARQEMTADLDKLIKLRELFWQKLSRLPGVSLNGGDAGYPGILNVCFAGVTSEQFMQAVPELSIAAGSACNSRGVEPSYVLRALGLSNAEAKSALRFSFGRFTTAEEIEFASDLIAHALSAPPSS